MSGDRGIDRTEQVSKEIVTPIAVGHQVRELAIAHCCHRLSILLINLFADNPSVGHINRNLAKAVITRSAVVSVGISNDSI